MAHSPSIAGLILAGGRGERLGGVVKSELVVGGVRLLDRVAARLDACTPLLVAHGHLPPGDLNLRLGMLPVADLDTPYAGPLAGLAAAIAILSAQPRIPDLILVAAVDAPFLPADYVARMAAGIGEHPAAIVAYGGQPYPTNSIWRTASLLDLPARCLAGAAPHSLKSLARECGAIGLEWPLQADGDPFANINTPEELEKMRERGEFST